jgi:hypothetical protein
MAPPPADRGNDASVNSPRSRTGAIDPFLPSVRHKTGRSRTSLIGRKRTRDVISALLPSRTIFRVLVSVQNNDPLLAETIVHMEETWHQTSPFSGLFCQFPIAGRLD